MIHLHSWLIRLMLGLAGIAAITYAFSIVARVSASTVGFLYLLIVLAVATTSGFRVSAVVSITATLCFNFFFLPPVGRLTVADPENWVALVTFLVTALVASHLSDRARNEAAEARRRQQETEQLYALSRSILLTEALREIGTQAAQSIAQIFDLPTVMIRDGKTDLSFRGGPQDLASLDQRLQSAIRNGSHERDEALDLDVWPITLGGNPVGALAAVGMKASDGAVQSMLNLVAIALERVRTEEAAHRAELARESEEFKSTLLDAIAHEFKTPLTSIKAAATGLRMLPEQLMPDQHELAVVIEEEADRLSGLVSEAVKMAEIDAGKVSPQLAPADPGALLRAAQASFQGRGAERIAIVPDGGEPCRIHVDGELVLLALRQVLDNALKYSDAGSPVQCSLVCEPERIVMRIADHGAGIPEQERHKVFEKFYRLPGQRDLVPGSGLGLHIARAIARIHGGDLWVEAAKGRGSVFCFAFPLAKEKV